MKGNPMNDTALTEFVAATAAKYDMPGMSVGVRVNGREIHANVGVTSTENPVPITEHTVFAIGSTSKTFTTTALMRLVADGQVDLDAPVRTYVPELKLADEQHAAAITVRQLLNHTAGLEWNLINNTGDGEDGLVLQRHLCESVLVDLLCGVGSCCGRVGFVDESDRGSVRAVGAARAGPGVRVGIVGGAGAQERVDAGRTCW
ncbi:serine hydrolase domain-containing protein [Nocardia seriolae]|uniref:serine hydrolase domain-containing protein n=3 Tax=Nocardia seriolae TaxID=37332 RepID=UPI0031CDE7BE